MYRDDREQFVRGLTQKVNKNFGTYLTVTKTQKKEFLEKESGDLDASRAKIVFNAFIASRAHVHASMTLINWVTAVSFFNP